MCELRRSSPCDASAACERAPAAAVAALRRCVALNALYAPCHTWLARALVAEGAPGAEAAAAAHRQRAGNLTFGEDDVLL